VKRCFNIILCISLVGCATSDVEDMRSNTFVMNAIIHAGDSVQRARVLTFDAESGESVPAEGALLLFNGEEWLTMVQEDGLFQTPAGSGDFEFETLGRIVFESDGTRLEADFTTPPPLNLLSSGPTSFSIDPNFPDLLVFAMAWTFLPGYEYVAQLIPNDPDGGEIPFEATGGLFSSRFSGPFVANSLALRSNDFRNYGLHTLHITAIDGPYRDIHFYNPVSPLGELNQGISNVQGGFGWVDAVTGFDIELMILP